MFEEHASSLFKRKYESELESSVVAELRDELLPKLISGEVRVKNAERFVDEVTA